MKTPLDKGRFGPWALVTGASSGIGKEFARRIAASGINVVLVARREGMLAEVGRGITQDFKVQHRVIAIDLSREGFIDDLAERVKDLDIGLVVSNAGTPIPGEFLKTDRGAMVRDLRLNTVAHLEISHYFGQKLARRRKGGLLLVGAMGSEMGIPLMANDSAAKAYVKALAQALHAEFRPLGLNVTLLAPGPTDTAALGVLGLTPKDMPMKPMAVEQCVSEGLMALGQNRSTIIPGRMNRIMDALVPASVKRTMTAKIFSKGLANKPAHAGERARA
jgi:uncharacterized protein